jgi:mono/diheme cytochrome c family protein
MDVVVGTPMQNQQPLGPRLRQTQVWPALVLVAVALSPHVVAAEGLTGEQVYRKRCTSCHGAAGEGTKEHRQKPLAGDKSVAQLAKLIGKTMPKDAPGSCTGEDAEKVAAYIYDAFYSKAARERNKPPRIELSRLTVRQYQNAVADLIGSFRTPGRWDNPRGLRGEYFRSYGFRNQNRVYEEIDPVIQFDFGEASPDFEKFEAHQFGIRWEGSVLAPETGQYEFIVRTEHAARLWINATDRPLIDAWVKAGEDTEHRAPIFLLGGRVYPLRLEFAKGKQGEVDGKKDETKPPAVKASIALEWKLPQRAAEVIPQRNLSPQQFPELFVAETPFPPDDRSVGYERGTSVSKAWDAATTDAAIEVAGYVLGHLRELSGADDGASDRAARLREFCRRFAERAFRRPLTTEQEQLYIERQFKDALNLETAVKRVVLLVLKSPRFLYREMSDDSYDVACRLSFVLWDSLPDQELLEAAAAGKLASREQIARQAERMVMDRRTHSKLREFLLQWLKVEPVPDLSKDPKQFSDFDPVLASDLRTSLDLFLEDVVWSEDSDFRRLLLADDVYLNGRLAKFYGLDLPADAPFQKAKLNPEQRAGVLTHPYLMAAFSYTASSSPIHRGVFLTRNVLGVSLRPPPEAFIPLAEDLHPKLTTRERVTLQTKPGSCQTCHGVINPLGFTLEHFDAVGRYREQDNGRPVDSAGTYETRTGEKVKVAGARDLAKFLAGSDEVHTAFAEQLFQHLVKQPVRAYGPKQLADLREFFAEHGFSIRKLAVEIATISALNDRKAQPPPAQVPAKPAPAPAPDG